MARTAQRKLLLSQNPFCYLCGGESQATTVDHVPPRACFPDGYEPDGLQFGACAKCNAGSSKHDQIFGLLSMFTDFDAGNRTPQQAEKFERLLRQVQRRYPEALSGIPGARPIYTIGHVAVPSPAAFTSRMTPDFESAIKTISIKLTHALYYRHANKLLTRNKYFANICYQLQDPQWEHTTAYLSQLLPELCIGGRPNRKDFGNRFAYKWGYKNVEDLFVYAAQFGRGLLIWGLVLQDGSDLKQLPGVLGEMEWQSGGCGLKS